MRVFVSWSGELSRTAADGFYQLVAAAFPAKYVRLFFSPKVLEPGDRWREILRRQLSSSDIAIIFLTRESKAAEWLLFEAGAVGRVLASRLYPVLVDLTHRDLPSPFEQFQASTLLDSGHAWALIWQIREQLRKAHNHCIDQSVLRQNFDHWWAGYKRRLEVLIDQTFTGSGDWSLVKEGLVAARIGGSPFQAKDIFRIARHRIDMVAQNHHYIAVDKEAQHLDLLRRFLKKGGRTVQILAMNPRNSGAVRAWTQLMRTPDFPDDLRAAVSTFRRWKQTALDEHWQGRLSIHLAGLIATSQTFFDPEHTHGGLIMVPMVNKPSNLDRPAMLITRRKHSVAFDSYWTAYVEQLRRASAL